MVKHTFRWDRLAGILAYAIVIVLILWGSYAYGKFINPILGIRLGDNSVFATISGLIYLVFTLAVLCLGGLLIYILCKIIVSFIAWLTEPKEVKK